MQETIEIISGMFLLLLFAFTTNAADPIIGGYGDFRYQYMPDKCVMPAGSAVQNSHGLAVDADKNIYLTYQPVNGKDTNCLVRWAPDGTNGTFLNGGGTALSSGTPHGLKITTENGKVFLYHANNNQKLTKTTLEGDIIWQVTGPPGNNSKWNPYKPTWFAVPPGSKYVYMADGYGSCYVHVFTTDGKYTGITYGGRGKEHGKFETNHGITYDPRVDKLVVSDRENHRLEFFDFDVASPNTFTYSSTVTLEGITRICNIRMYPEQEGRAIVPDLTGPVAVLAKNNSVISIVNVSKLLGDQGHKHPHDAVFLPNGDMVVATWAPGRISYWKKL